MATRHAQSLPTNLSYPHRLPALSLQTYDSDTSFLRLSFIPISRVQLSSIHFEQNHRHLRVKQLSLSTPTRFSLHPSKTRPDSYTHIPWIFASGSRNMLFMETLSHMSVCACAQPHNRATEFAWKVSDLSVLSSSNILALPNCQKIMMARADASLKLRSFFNDNSICVKHPLVFILIFLLS